MLLDRGVSPRVDFIPVTESRRYEGLEDAQESLLWMLPDATPAETERLRAWLGSALVAGEDGGWRLAPRAVRWAVLSWNKEDAPGGRT